mmetsp:Transcript_22034/g.70323  ORF Transcript_22034/g.70323 Transcript_22034/m.70323 type:complete len:177 (+) Transcript_22034:47-577(+)
MAPDGATMAPATTEVIHLSSDEEEPAPASAGTTARRTAPTSSSAGSSSSAASATAAAAASSAASAASTSSSTSGASASATRTDVDLTSDTDPAPPAIPPEHICVLCRTFVPRGPLAYVLNECRQSGCRQRHHRRCLAAHVVAELGEKLAADIGCPSCGKPLSIRDVTTRPSERVNR